MDKKQMDLLQGTLDMLILKAVSLGPLHGYGLLPSGHKRPHFYRPFAQRYTGLATLVVETSTDAATVAPRIRSAVRAESAGVRIFALEPLAAHVERSGIRGVDRLRHASAPARRCRPLWRNGVSRCSAHTADRVTHCAGRSFRRGVPAHFAGRHEDHFAGSGLGDTWFGRAYAVVVTLPLRPQPCRPADFWQSSAFMDCGGVARGLCPGTPCDEGGSHGGP